VAKLAYSLSTVGYPAPWGKIIFAPPTTKTTKFQRKNRRKSAAEEEKAEHLLFVTFVIF